MPAEGDRVTVTLLRAVPWAGRARFRGTALHGARMSAEIDGEIGRPVVADHEGRFRLDVPASLSHQLVLHFHWSGETAIRSWTHPLRDRAATEIELDTVR